MSIQTSTLITVTAPAATDGRGEVATINDATSVSTHVGRLWGASGFGGAAVRTSMDDVVEGPGAVFSPFYDSARSFTLTVLLSKASTWALSDARFNKLCKAFYAMQADGSITWTDNDAITKLINFRCEQPPADPNPDTGEVLLACTAADPRIYSNTALGTTSPTTNAGTIDSLPTFTFTPTGGNVVITDTTGGHGSPAVTLRVGAGYLATGSAVTVNFRTKAVTQGGVNLDGAVVFPAGWWALWPGIATSWTVTNASSVTITARSAWRSG